MNKKNHRNSVQKTQHLSNRLFRKGVYITISLMLILAVILFLVSFFIQADYFLPIRIVEVKGELSTLNKEQLEQLQQSVTPFLQSNFFDIGVRRIQQSIEQLPWVSRVEVRRIWPDTLSINIMRESIVARWNGISSVNKYGEITSNFLSQDKTDLPLLIGPSINFSSKELSYFQQINGLLAPLHLQVHQLILEKNGNWTAVLDQGTYLMLGQDNVLEKLTQFVRAYPKVFTKQSVKAQRIDLRYNHGMAIQWVKD